MSRKVNIFRAASAAPSCSDADVDAFFALAGMDEVTLTPWLTSIGRSYSQVKLAVCNFITALKDEGIYNLGSTDAMYLPIGNTSTQRRYNFIGASSLFTLSFFGGITFTNFSVKGNGVNGYTTTGWQPSLQGAANRSMFAIDSADDIATSSQVIGGAFTSPDRRMFFNAGLPATPNIQIANTFSIIFSGTRKGLFVSRRNGTNFNQSYRDGVSLGTNTALYTPPISSFILNALNNNGTPSIFAQHGVNFAYLSGAAWSEAQVLTLGTAYSTLKTALGIP